MLRRGREADGVKRADDMQCPQRMQDMDGVLVLGGHGLEPGDRRGIDGSGRSTRL